MTARPSRASVPVDQTWDLDSLYPAISAWEADLTRVDAQLAEVEQYRGKLSEGAGRLLCCLRLRDQISQAAARVGWFAYNRASEDQGDPERTSLKDRAMAMSARVESALSFIKPELLALPDGSIGTYLAQEADLGVYQLDLDDLLAEKAHMLGPEAEAVIAQMTELTQAPYDIWQNTTNADIRFDPVTDEHGNQVPMGMGALGKLLQSPDRSVRQAAYNSALKAYGAHKRTLTAAFAAAQKRDVILARLRRYPSALHAALEQDHLPVELFHNLLRVSEEKAAPHFQRYMAYRLKELGVERLMPYDLAAPLDTDVDAEVTIRDACGMVLASLEPLGPEYRAIVEQAFRERWIDWGDNAGKAYNAYSYGCYGYHPVILLSWQGKIADVFTLTHELGHAVHSTMSARKQPYVYAGYTSFLAEMASTTNEILLARYLLKTTQNRSLRRYVLTRALGAFTSNFFGGSMMAALQQQVHEMVEQGKPLTYESVTAANVAIQKRWYGETVEVTPDGSGSTWMRPLHHFRNFYSYQYATGISAAAAFSDAIMTEGEPAVQRFLGFLSAGSSAHSMDILKAAGLDMTTPEPVEKAAALFGELVSELERS